MSEQLNNVASWNFFGLGGINNSSTNASSPHAFFDTFQQSINLLIDGKILIPKKLYVDFPFIEKHRSKFFDLDGFSKLQLAQLLNEISLDYHPDLSLTLTGGTIAFGAAEFTKHIENNIRIDYRIITYPHLKINFVNDIWTPIDRKWNWQIELAENNSYRIPNFLNKLEREIKFEDSYPKKNEYYHQFVRPQKDYRIGITEMDFNYASVESPCPSDKIDFVKSFILKP
jgi:hypothetical protein